MQASHVIVVGLVLVCVVGSLSVRTLRPCSVSETAQPHQLHGLEHKYHQWLSTFQASDPSYQLFCAEVLQNRRHPDKGAQFSQDIFLFNDFFKYWPLQEGLLC